MNFFLVDSPLQLLNAIEAKHFFNIKRSDAHLIIFEGVSDKNFRQLKSLSENQDWKCIYRIKKNQADLYRYISLFKINKIIYNHPNIQKVFIGDYRSDLMRHFVHNSNCSESILLDDGTASHIVQKQILNKSGIYNQLTPLRKLVNSIFGVRCKDIFNINFFTIYNCNLSRSYCNTYAYFRKVVDSLSFVDEVYFLGNNTPELGVVDLQLYYDKLAFIKEYFSSKRILYIPHRRESAEKIEVIKGSLGFEVKDFNMPIEWVINKEKVIPAAVASFFSSALDNCHMIYGEKMDIYAFKLSANKISANHREKYLKVYEKYESYKGRFNVVSI